MDRPSMVGKRCGLRTQDFRAPDEINTQKLDSRKNFKLFQELLRLNSIFDLIDFRRNQANPGIQRVKNKAGNPTQDWKG